MVQFASLLGLLPVEWLAISPREHLYELLGRAISLAVVGTHILTCRPAILGVVVVVSNAGLEDDLRTSLADIRKAIGKAISLGSLGCRLYEMVRIAVVGILIEEVFTCLLALLPQLRLLATHPSQTVLTRILHGILAAVIRLVVVEQWRSSKLQYTALHRHGSRLGPVCLHGSDIIIRISKRKGSGIDSLIIKLEDEIECLLYRSTWRIQLISVYIV